MRSPMSVRVRHGVVLEDDVEGFERNRSPVVAPVLQLVLSYTCRVPVFVAPDRRGFELMNVLNDNEEVQRV